ncbi:MAG TPA: hypothetical protein VHM24_10930, partial [Gemmatimonadaceae bacterium]|nr:hypothetical protein [Gemmatimonadaceae bacterium]
MPLWLLIVASQLPDWTDAAACIARVHSDVPGMISHSLPAAAVLAVVTATAWYWKSGDWRGMLIV